MVRIRSKQRPLAAGLAAEIECEAAGSKPLPVISWWRGKAKIPTDHVKVRKIYLSTSYSETITHVSFSLESMKLVISDPIVIRHSALIANPKRMIRIQRFNGSAWHDA